MSHSAPTPVQPTTLDPQNSRPEVSENLSLASTPHSPFHDPPPATTSPSQKLGALHLQPATVEDLFEIDRYIYGDYDLIDGLLIARDSAMTEDDRNKEQVKNLMYIHHRRQRSNPNGNLKATIEATVAIPTKRYLRSQPSSSTAQPLSDSDSSNSSTDGTPSRGNQNYSVVQGDLAIGPQVPPEERARLSPSSQKMSFPLRHPPSLVVESTSTNEKRDTVDKKKMYARAKVPKYVILNNKARSKTGEPAVFEGNLRNGRYEGLDKPLRGTDEVNLGPIGAVPAHTCLNPGLADDRERKLNQEMKEEQARKDAEMKKLKEEQARKDAEMKDKQAWKDAEIKKLKDKNTAYRLRLRDAGITVTNSSSSSSGSSNSRSSPNSSSNSSGRSSPVSRRVSNARNSPTPGGSSVSRRGLSPRNSASQGGSPVSRRGSRARNSPTPGGSPRSRRSSSPKSPPTKKHANSRSRHG